MIPIRPIFTQLFFFPVAVRRKRRPRDPGLHHLALVNGVWCVRLTLDRGPKFIGERVKISLGTGNAELAMKMRDRILKAYRCAGVKVARCGEN